MFTSNYEQEMEKVFIREQQGVFCRSLLKKGFDVFNHTFDASIQAFYLLNHESGMSIKYYIKRGEFYLKAVDDTWDQIGTDYFPASARAKKSMLKLVLSQIPKKAKAA